MSRFTTPHVHGPWIELLKPWIPVADGTLRVERVFPRREHEGRVHEVWHPPLRYMYRSICRSQCITGIYPVFFFFLFLYIAIDDYPFKSDTARVELRLAQAGRSLISQFEGVERRYYVYEWHEFEIHNHTYYPLNFLLWFMQCTKSMSNSLYVITYH